jgi:hypothetical protein
MRDGRPVLYVAIACLAYVAALLATPPSSWISSSLERLSNRSLQLRDPRGSAWAGNGSLYLRQQSGNFLSLGTLRWNTSLAAVFSGRFVTDFRLGETGDAARLELALGGVTLRGLRLVLPGEILAEFAPGLSALGPRGRLRIQSETLSIGDNEILGAAQIEWRPTRLAAAEGLNLGSHIARLRGNGRKVDVDLGTSEGPLRMSGGGTWTIGEGPAISGTLQHDANQGGFAPFLQSVCSEYANGRCAFRIGR